MIMSVSLLGMAPTSHRTVTDVQIIRSIEQSGNPLHRFQNVVDNLRTAYGISVGRTNELGIGPGGIWITNPCGLTRVDIGGPKAGSTSYFPISGVNDCNLGLGSLVDVGGSLVLTSRSTGVNYDAIGNGEIFENAETFTLPVVAATPINVNQGPVWCVYGFGYGTQHYVGPFGNPEFAIPGWADSIALGSDGNYWFPLPNLNEIGRMTPTGGLTTFTLPPNVYAPSGIIAGYDGNLWLSLSNGIARLTLAGDFTEFTIWSEQLSSLVSTPDGDIWFVGSQDKMVDLSPDGYVTAYHGPRGSLTGYFENNSTLATVGPDDNIWIVSTHFYEQRANPPPGFSNVWVFYRDAISFSPNALELIGADQTIKFTVHEDHFKGPWRIVNSNPRIVRVVATSNDRVFEATSLAIGNASLTVHDEMGNTASLPVEVNRRP